jgi:cytidylate kinase
VRKPIVAIDGPAGSGKSTTARAVAEQLGFAHIDSGAVYRACTLVALRRLGDPAAWEADDIVAAAGSKPVVVRAAAGHFEVRIGNEPAEPAIRDEEVTRHVSRVAAMGMVRDFVNAMLRAAAKDGGVVMDGRDIGTVVFPDAEVKVFLIADAAERARRRLNERGMRSTENAIGLEAGALEARDRRDSTREVAPLLRAPDAVVLDTTSISFAEQVRRVVALVQKANQPLP